MVHSSSALQVLFICPSLVGAGVERRVCTLFRELCRTNFDVRLGLLRAEGEFLQEIPVTRRVFLAPDARVKWLLRKLFRSENLVNGLLGIVQIRSMLKKIRPGVVVSFTLETTIPMYLATRGGAFQGISWIISEDSNTAAATLECCKPALIARVVRAMLGKIYRTADYVNCVSDGVADAVCAVYRVDKARISSLPNPIDVARVQNGVRESWQPLFEASFIVAVGRLVAIKQFDLLIRAYAEIRKTRRVKLVILGEGPERINLSRVVAECGLHDDVLFPGFVHNPWIYMAHASVLVLTSKLEGFGNVIVEAMAAGCPVIATRCGGPEEIIRHRWNGLLVNQETAEIAEAIRLLLDDRVLSRRLAENARMDLENYLPVEIAQQFGALLQRIANNQDP